MAPAPEPSSAPLPAEICGYTVDCALSSNQTFLAIGPGGRGIVLKRLDTDCLLRGLLHPSIRERLCRVRELAHRNVANLHGVGREGEHAYLIWEYLPGRTFDEYLADAGRTPRDLLVLARELILGVDSLHMQGIVHGAIVGGNVIIGPDASVRLTHISPLLYTDMSVDVESVIGMLEQAVESRGEQDSPLGRLLAEATRDGLPLRQLGTRVAALLESRGGPAERVAASEDRHLRRRMLVGAAAAAVLALVLAGFIWYAVTASPETRGILRRIPGLGTAVPVRSPARSPAFVRAYE